MPASTGLVPPVSPPGAESVPGTRSLRPSPLREVHHNTNTISAVNATSTGRIGRIFFQFPFMVPAATLAKSCCGDNSAFAVKHAHTDELQNKKWESREEPQTTAMRGGGCQKIAPPFRTFVTAAAGAPARSDNRHEREPRARPRSSCFAGRACLLRTARCSDNQNSPTSHAELSG